MVKPKNLEVGEAYAWVPSEFSDNTGAVIVTEICTEYDNWETITVKGWFYYDGTPDTQVQPEYGGFLKTEELIPISDTSYKEDSPVLAWLKKHNVRV